MSKFIEAELAIAQFSKLVKILSPWDYKSYVTSEENLTARYLASVELHLTELVNVYKRAFDSSYRRRSATICIEVDRRLQIEAQTKAAGKTEISIGLVLAMEDSAHALLSDPLTSIARNQTGEDRNIHGLQDWEYFDSQRYVDYGKMALPCVDHNVADPRTICSFLFRLRSQSLFRQQLADVMADVGLMWVLAHEDAHGYLGHIDAKKSKRPLQATPNENESTIFDELIGEIFDSEESKIRKSMEYNADTNASTRIADHIIDTEFIEMNPVLDGCVDELRARFENSDEMYGEASEGILRFVALTRFAVSSVALAVAVLHRSAQKRSDNVSGYPSYAVRLLNITVSIITRAHRVAETNPRYRLEVPHIFQLYVIGQLIAEDIESIHRNVLTHGICLNDLSMENEENRMVVEQFKTPNFKASFAKSLMWTLYRLPELLPNAHDPAGSLIRSFLREHAEHQLVVASEFRQWHLSQQAHIAAKVSEGLDHDFALANEILSALKNSD